MIGRCNFLAAVLVVLSTEQGALAVDPPMRFTIPAPSGAIDVSSMKLRARAAEDLLRRVRIGSQPGKDLLISVLVANPNLMQITLEAQAATCMVVCPNPDQLSDFAQMLFKVEEVFGKPIVLVEAERPEHPHDRSAVAQFSAELSKRGFRIVDASSVRDTRRQAVDSAVEGGLPGDQGLSLIDHPTSDFILRVGEIRKCDVDPSVYGIAMQSCAVTLSPLVIRSANQAVIQVAATSATWRSSSLLTAEQMAEGAALGESIWMASSVIATEWLAIANGERPSIVEIDAPTGEEVGALAKQLGDGKIQVLENRPGVRSVFQLDSKALELAKSDGSIGELIYRRPGYRLFKSQEVSSFRWFTILAVGLFGTIVIVGWRLRHSRSD